MDYRQAMMIDEANLDREWAGQADRYMEFAEHAAAASALVDELKDRLGVEEAEAEERIRNSNDDMKEAAVKAAVLLDRRVRDAKAKLNATKKELALVRGAVDAMDHRKRALENLVQLHLSNYRSTPRIRDEGAREAFRTTSADTQNKAVAEAMQPRRGRRN